MPVVLCETVELSQWMPQPAPPPSLICHPFPKPITVTLENRPRRVPLLVPPVVIPLDELPQPPFVTQLLLMSSKSRIPAPDGKAPFACDQSRVNALVTVVGV